MSILINQLSCHNIPREVPLNLDLLHMHHSFKAIRYFPLRVLYSFFISAPHFLQVLRLLIAYYYLKSQYNHR